MNVSTGSESQIQPNRAQVGLYTPSEKYVSELTVQRHSRSTAKGLLANENSPGGPIQNLGPGVRANGRAHTHFLFSPSHRAKPLRQYTVQPSQRRPGRRGPNLPLSDSACSRREGGNSAPSAPAGQVTLHRVLRQVLQGDDVHAHVVGAAVTLLVLAHGLDGAHVRVGRRHRRHAGHATTDGLGA